MARFKKFGSQNPDEALEKKLSLTLSSEVLQSLFENGKSPLSVQFIRWKLWKKWTEFAGTSIAAVSEPVGYYRGVLYLWVKNASWMQQLQFMKDPLRQTINKKLEIEYVTEIKLTMDRRSVPLDAQQNSDLREALSKLLPESQDLE